MTGAAIGFWRTVRLLSRTARRRSRGRRERQRQLLNNRSGPWATDWGSAGVVLALLIMVFLHGAAAYAVISAVEAGQRAGIEAQGKLVVSDRFYTDAMSEGGPRFSDSELREEARRIADHDGGDERVIGNRLRDIIASSGNRRLVSRDEAEPGLAALGRSGTLATILGSFLLLWWFAMLVCQGEGLELDLQRRRHPIWEWLLSHPIGAGAMFFAEMLSPIAANPTYWAAPVFPGILYGVAEGPEAGLAAAFLIGVPLSFAAACVGKALEIGAMLRLPTRSRGAAIGVMSWFGYASLISMFFALSLAPHIATVVGGWVGDTTMPWPILRLFLGIGADGSVSLLRGTLTCGIVSCVLMAASLMFSAHSIRRGLSGAFAADALPIRAAGPARFGREPLFRKEYLWFVRDRSAIVQTILIPITVAGFQLFNLRALLLHAGDSWNYLAGAAIFFGTYFLWVLGPKSLTSEGAALWIAMTWPRGLESMLKAKAWLWSMIASGLVAIVLLFACWLFPHAWWQIGLVGIGWFLFARTMADKAVTLVTIVSESGEAQKIPLGRRWAAQLGMLTFAIGIVSQQWHLAIVGIVYSWITAAAMWEHLRARLPYLYDPWSERLPPPPTLMHAMVAISILVECTSVLTGVMFGFGGKNILAVAQGVSYAVCAVGVSIGVAQFLSDRGVRQADIWCWNEAAPEARIENRSWLQRYVAGNRRELSWLAVGILGGLSIGLIAHLYLDAIALIPSVEHAMRASRLQMQSIPGIATAYAVLAIGFAPFAEEYLFRGLLFRTLDREWGGWRAVAGAAAFFGIYHPPTSWLPVALVGAANCLLFKRSGKLAPAILLHMTYNIVVILWT